MNKTLFFAAIAAIILLSGCVQPNTGNGTENGGNTMNTEKVEAGDKISVEYRGTLADGTQFDASEGRGPLEFTAGAGQMIKGFDNAVIGMALNEEKTITLQPAQAYGETRPPKTEEIKKSYFPDVENLKVGMRVTISPTGDKGIVKEIKDDVVVVDFDQPTNHPLAGKTLTFWIKVVSINGISNK